jgi:hypothetical protein
MSVVRYDVYIAVYAGIDARFTYIHRASPKWSLLS